MLHTGTMFAVIAFFWNQWKETYFSGGEAFKQFAGLLIWATLLTGIVGLATQEGHRKDLVSWGRKGRD